MNAGLQCFDFEQLPVRVIERDGQPWFVAADVCRVLELTNPTESLRGLDDDEAITLSTTEGNPRNGIAHQQRAVSESGLYALIFKSRKPQAKVFRKWVTAEVLPALRAAGRYEMAGAPAEPLEMMSLLRFVEQACNGWSLDRQMDFGQTARRYAKAMGVVFQVGADPEMGRVFIFPRSVLARVHQAYARTTMLPDSDAVEFERLLESVLLTYESGVRITPDIMRGLAKMQKLFPRIFGKETSLASERSSFGRLCERFDGLRFPSGLMLTVRGTGGRVSRKYEVTRVEREATTAVSEGRAA